MSVSTFNKWDPFQIKRSDNTQDMRLHQVLQIANPRVNKYSIYNT
jgi:hypothetical protein